MSSHGSSSTGSTVRSHNSRHSSRKSTDSKKSDAKSLENAGRSGRALRQSKIDYVKSHDAFKTILTLSDEDILQNSEEYLQNQLHPAFGHALDHCKQYICMLDDALKATPVEDQSAIEDYRRRIAQATGVKQSMTKNYGHQVQRISNLDPKIDLNPAPSVHSSAPSSRKSNKSDGHSVISGSSMTGRVSPTVPSLGL